MRRWYAFIIGLTLAWAITLLWVLTVPSLETAIALLFISVIVEMIGVSGAMLYIAYVRRETGDPASWLLWLFAFGAAVMLFGLMPAAISFFHRVAFDRSFTETPGLFLASSILFIGVVPMVTAAVIWWHRRGL